ncbi:MAG: hypothetical protein FJ279_36995, partial [Planctomycetes bacterium]|nr:hypothetical protein [Planctomycetota bacterium]
MSRLTPSLLCLAIGAIFSACGLADEPSITGLSEQALQQRLRGDVTAVRTYRSGLQAILGFVRSRPDAFPTEKPSTAWLPSLEQKQAIRGVWQSALDYILALDSIRRYYRDFDTLKSKERLQDTCVVAYGAFVAQYSFALQFIAAVEKSPDLATVLDEPIPELGLPRGTYGRFKFRYLNVGCATEFGARTALYKAFRGQRHAELHAAIAEDESIIWKMGRGKGELLTVVNALDILKKAGFAAWFPVQAGVSEWMGDAKVYRIGQSLVSQPQIQAMLPRLEPGDILLERREWYLSNIGLPGFWPHAALFIGTPQDRRVFFKAPDVEAWVREQGQADGDFDALLRAKYPKAYSDGLKPQEHGHVPRVIEAISEGVVFTTIEHSADADSVAVLRPRLPKHEKAAAILRAFHYHGRPYDFDFDFRTDSSLVCTELVFKAYEPGKATRGLRFPLVLMLGRPVCPANEMARQFDAQFG